MATVQVYDIKDTIPKNDMLKELFEANIIVGYSFNSYPHETVESYTGERVIITSKVKIWIDFLLPNGGRSEFQYETLNVIDLEERLHEFLLFLKLNWL